tara:strand:- start:45 stop:404 length:360 start_codon:yes stop_codon:yes gene_type:complete
MLPKTFTIGDALDALYRKRFGALKDIAEAEQVYEDYLKPYMDKTWFGLYREVTNKPDTYHASSLRRHIKEAKWELDLIVEREKLLRKYPLEAKVGLDEEDMEWFGKDLYRRDDYNSKGL